MKITDLKIDGFGIWSNLAVQGLGEDVAVFYGPNEAGKTTLMQFIRAVLYGFSRERRQRYLPPVHGGRPGGQLRLSTMRGEFDVVRRLPTDDAGEILGDITLLDDSGNVQHAHQLSSLLGGVDESIFTNVFAIGLKEMQELGALNDSAAADQLYKLTSGLDRVSLIDVVRDLATSRTNILSSEHSGELMKLLGRREKLQNEIEELATRGRRWPQLMAERAERGREIEQVEHGIADVQKQMHDLDLLLSVREKWGARRQVEEQLATFGAAADLPPDILDQLDAVNGSLKKYRRRLHGARKQRTSLREDLARHTYNRQLVAQASRIQALGEHAPWIGALEDEVSRLESESTVLEREVEARRPQLEGAAASGSRSKLPEITPKTLSLLRGPATRLNHLNKLVDRAQNEAQAVKLRSEQALQRVSTELADLDESSLTAALEKAGTRVAQLRRRIQVEERLEHLTLQHNELEGQSQELFDWQVMPFEKMAWLFGAFVLSSVMILGGVFGGLLWGFSWFFGLLLTFFGFVGLGAAIVWKLDWERNAERQFQSVERQLELLDQQIEETRAEQQELDQQLPPGGGPLDARLAQAERQLQHLEQLTPMDAQRHESGQHVDAVERRAARAAEELKEAKKNWQTALRSAGLPENLSPNDVRHLARSFRTVLAVRKQLTQRKDELETRRRELASLAGRINELFVELGLQPESDSAQARLRQLAGMLAEQQKIVERRRDVQSQLRQLRGRWQKAVRGYEVATRARKTLLSKADASNEDQIRQMVARQHQAQLLVAQREELTQQIQRTLGDRWPEEQLTREFTAKGDDAPAQRRDRLVRRLQEHKEKMSQLHEDRGQLAAEMKTMVADRRLDQAKVELGCIDQQIVDAVGQWQLLAVTGLLLESVRGIYETTRQPETLREASVFLQRLTQGQYTRIWTPIEEKILRVDDARGASLSLDKLSSGTREAVFLSLRLALVAGYARRGAALPLILDDVLVNFDSGRVRAAALVLREFSQRGHQLLLFTCHEHIMQIFHEVGAEVRLLPGRGGATPGEVPAAKPAAKPAAQTPVEKPIEPPVTAPVESPMEQPAPRRKKPERRRDAAPPERVERPAAVKPAPVERPAAVEPILEEPVIEEPIAEEPLTPVLPVAEPMPERPRARPRVEPKPQPAFPLALADVDDEEEYRLAHPEPTIAQRIDPLPLLISRHEPITEPMREARRESRESEEAAARREYARRFTWESPEMYWRRDEEDEAVA